MIVNRDERRACYVVRRRRRRLRALRGPVTPRTPSAGSRASEPRDVVDLGAGTGKLTRSLVALGHRVTAVEPLPEMLEHLVHAVPGVTVVAGRRGGDPARGRERRRRHGSAGIPLVRPRPGVARRSRGCCGRVARSALVWNTRDDREPWVAKLSEEVIGQRDGRGARREDARRRRAVCSRSRASIVLVRPAPRSGRAARSGALAQLLRGAQAEERAPVLAASSALRRACRGRHARVAVPDRVLSRKTARPSR